MPILSSESSSPATSDAESEVTSPSASPSSHHCHHSHDHLRTNTVDSSWNNSFPSHSSSHPSSSPPPTPPSSSSSSSLREKKMMKCLHKQLEALEAMVPATSRSSSPFSVISDALRYKKALKKEIQRMQMFSPYAHQVKVVKRGGDLQIRISCKKKSGLLIALMEVMEGAGLVFSYVDVSCQEDIDIKALSKQGSITPDSLKLALMTTIGEFESV